VDIWDAIGNCIVEHVAGVGRLRGRGDDLSGGGGALAKGAGHATAGRAGGDEKLDGISAAKDPSIARSCAGMIAWPSEWTGKRPPAFCKRGLSQCPLRSESDRSAALPPIDAMCQQRTSRHIRPGQRARSVIPERLQQPIRLLQKFIWRWDREARLFSEFERHSAVGPVAYRHK
jgi:hypothetical protein